MTFQSMLSVDPFTGIRLIGALLLFGAVPGAALVRLLFRRPSWLQYAVYGVVVGLALWSMGGMLSHLTGIPLVRWVPAVAALALWFVRPRRRGPAPARRATVPWHGISGAVLAIVALLPSLRAALASQPADWQGWQLFHGDLPFQVALTSEVAVRAPEQLPWVAGTELSYTWLFHSAMGVWASGAGATAAEVVLQAWPVLFILIFPVLIAMIAYDLTRQRWVAFAAPLIFVLAHGLLTMVGTIEQVPVFQVSPTRDFASVLTLMVVLCLVKVLGRGSGRAVSPWWLVALALTTFTAAGSKGSAMPILVGGVLAAGFVLLVTRRLRRWDLLAAAVFGVSAIVAFRLVLPAPGANEGLAFGPFSFLTPDIPNRLALSVVITGLLLVTVIGLWLAMGLSRPRNWTVPTLLGGILLAGVAGQGFLTHPAGSQLYFWQSAQPVLAIALAWTGVSLVRRHGRQLPAALLVIWLVTNAVWLASLSILVTTAVLLVATVAGTVFLSRAGRAEPTSGAAAVAGIVAIAALLLQGGQLVSIPAGTSGGGPADETHAGAIHVSQLQAFDYLRTHAGVDDLIASNKHCYYGTVADGDCDGLWFALAAWTERAVLVDGWKYTQYGPDPEWVADRLGASDAFIADPSTATLRALEGAGVDWVYVDLREPHSDELADFAELAFSGEFAAVYRLR